MNRKLLTFLVLILLVPFVLAACTTATEEPTEPPMDETEMPMDETEMPMDETEMPMDETEMPMMVDLSGQVVSFWHVWGSGGEAEVLQAIVDEFNANNEYGITVESLSQGSYSDVENAFNAAIQSGDLPSLVAGYTNALANWYAVDALIDLNTFVNDPDYGLSADQLAGIYEGSLNGGVTPAGVRVGWPMSQSANVLFYNVSFAQDLGFDSAPTNSAEFKEQACAAQAFNNSDDDPDNDGTGGLVMYASTSNVYSWLTAFGGTVINAAGDGYDFTSDTMKDVAAFLRDLQDSDCTLTTESYPNPEFATRKALFVMSSTAGISFQLAAFEDAGSADEWTLLPFMGPDGTQTVNSFGQYMGVVATTHENELATWLFLQYLTSPEVQARWNQASAYFPTQGATVPLLGDYASENPIWALGLELTQYGVAEPAYASWTSVRRAMQDAFFAIMGAETADEIDAILEELNQTAADLVAETQ